MNETLKTVILYATLLFGVAIFFSFLSEKRNLEKVSYDSISNISMSEDYDKDFKIYKSKFGFSFQYPDRFSLKDNPTHLIPEQLFILTNPVNNKYNIYGVIIRVSENDDGVDRFNK